MLIMSKLIELWAAHGGEKHGPRVETVTMPYEKLAAFMEAAFEQRSALEFRPPAEEARRQALIEAARVVHGSDDVNIDEDARLSEADEGCWVQAWVWVEYPDEGEGEEPC